MCDTYRRVCRIDALAAMTRRTIDIYADIRILDVDLNVVIGLRQDNHFGGRGMDTTIGFCHRDALYTVRATLVFDTAVGALTLDYKGNVFDAALFGIIDVQHLNLPASVVRVAVIHTEQLACEESGLITTGSTLN